MLIIVLNVIIKVKNFFYLLNTATQGII